MKRKRRRISGFFIVDQIHSMEDLKKQYYTLAKRFHPDAGGTNQAMQEINNEFERLESQLARGQHFTTEESTLESRINEVYREIINSIIKYPSLTVEIIGSWIWVSGNTYPVRKDLKAAGFIFAPVKKMWFWRPEEYATTHNRSELTIDDIRRKYGSEIVTQPFEGRYLTGIGSLGKKLIKLQRLMKKKSKSRISGIGKQRNMIASSKMIY